MCVIRGLEVVPKSAGTAMEAREAPMTGLKVLVQCREHFELFWEPSKAHGSIIQPPLPPPTLYPCPNPREMILRERQCVDLASSSVSDIEHSMYR